MDCETYKTEKARFERADQIKKRLRELGEYKEALEKGNCTHVSVGVYRAGTFFGGREATIIFRNPDADLVIAVKKAIDDETEALKAEFAAL